MKSNIISSYHHLNRKIKRSFRFDYQLIHQHNSRFRIYYEFRKLLKQKDESLNYCFIPAVTSVSTSPFSNFIKALSFSASVRRTLLFSIFTFLFQTTFTLSSIAQNKPKNFSATITGFTYTRDDSTAVTNHLVRLKNSLGIQIDSVLTGNSNQWQFLNVPTGVKSESYSSPASFALFQNYPNPFNPHTTIRYEVSIGAAITIDVFDIKGEKVITLVNEYKSPGRYEVQWDAATDKGAQAAEGVYLVRMIADGNQIVKKMIFLHKAALPQGTASFPSNKYYQENSINNEFDYTLEIINLAATNPQIADTQFTFPLTSDTTLYIYASRFETVNVTISSFVEMMTDSVSGKFQTIHLIQNGNILQTKSTGDSGRVTFDNVAKNRNYTIYVAGDTASRPNVTAKDTILFIDKDTAIVVKPKLYLRDAVMDSLGAANVNEDQNPSSFRIHDLWQKTKGYDSLGNQVNANAIIYAIFSQTNPNLASVSIEANQYTKLDSLLSNGNGFNYVNVRALAPNSKTVNNDFQINVKPLADIVLELLSDGNPVHNAKVEARNNDNNVFYTLNLGNSNIADMQNLSDAVKEIKVLSTDSSNISFAPYAIIFPSPYSGDTSLVANLIDNSPAKINVTSLVDMLSGSVLGKYQKVKLIENGNLVDEKSTGDSGKVNFSAPRNKTYTISVIGDTASRPNILNKDTILFLSKDTAIAVKPSLYLRPATLSNLENKTFNEDEYPANPILHDLWAKVTGYDSLGNTASPSAFNYMVVSQTNPNLAPVIIHANQYTKLDSLLRDGNGSNDATVRAVAPNSKSDQKTFRITVSPRTDRKGQLKDIYGNAREGYIFARNSAGQQFIVQTDAQGNFAYQMNNGITWDSLKAQIKNDVRPSEGGFIRAMYFTNPSDLNNITVVAVPHLSGSDYIGLDTLDSFIKEANFDWVYTGFVNSGKLKKADLNNMLDFISSIYIPSGDTIKPFEQDYIINIIGQRIDPYFNSPSAKWKVPQDSAMSVSRENAINWFKDHNGWIGSIGVFDKNGDGILEKASIKLSYIINIIGQDTIGNDRAIVQEGLSGRVAPGEVGFTSTIPAPNTVLHKNTPRSTLQPADIWLVKICENYPALTPHDDILKKGNYQQEFYKQAGLKSTP